MTTKDIKRKLTAILSADVQGYSRLMGDDERATVETITAYRKVMTDLIQEHHGRVVDAKGDNVLAEFPSVVDAIQCAVEIQKELKVKNADLPEHRRMEFRIGINLGDVIEKEETIYGDGVNVAARLESLAEGGGICISGTAFDQIGKKVPLGYEYLGEQTVKNIEKPIRVYKALVDPESVGKVIGEKPRLRKWHWAAPFGLAVLLVAGALAFWNFYLRPDVKPASIEKMAYPLPDKPSIAVLPFDNMSGDPKQEYFSDGITEQIISSLAKVPQLFVIARNSSFTYRGKPVKVQQVAKELGVRYVLEGSVQRSGDRVRITAQLIDAKTGNHIWSENYDRDVKDIFALQDEITMKIIPAIQVKLTAGEAARMRARGTDNREAYDKYIKAMKCLQRLTKGELHKARKVLDEVIELDPGWSMPYSFQSLIHLMDMLMGWSTSRLQSMQKAEELAQKAVSLDDENALAHAYLCFMYLMKRQYENSFAEGKRAIELGPNLFQAHLFLGQAFNFAGKPAEAISFLETAIRLNPLPDPNPYLQLGVAYRDLGQYDKAITACKKGLRISPDHMFLHFCLSSIYSLAGSEKEARAEAAEVLRINPNFSLGSFSKAVPYKNQADRDRVVNAMRKAGLK